MRSMARLWALRAAGTLYPKQPQAGGAPRSLLLIRPDHLGDVLFLTPALHALRLALPSARLTLLVGPWGAEALRGNPDPDAVEVCPFPGFERKPKASAWAPYRLLRRQAHMLRQGEYDAAVVLRFDHWWGAWLAAAAGIPQRLGHDWPATRPFLTRAIPYDPGRHEVQQNGALLEALIPGSHLAVGPTRFAVAEADRLWAAGWLAAQGAAAEQRVVAIHPGAGAAIKQWPPAAWSTVARQLAEQPDIRILLTGSAAERPLADAIAAQLATPALNAAGATTLGQLAALLERCALVIGSDSGPLHLAVAVGAPTLHLYGPVDPAKFGPWGNPLRHRVLTTPWPCAPCNRLDWPAPALPRHACMAAIEPDAVLQAALAMLAS